LTAAATSRQTDPTPPKTNNNRRAGIAWWLCHHNEIMSIYCMCWEHQEPFTYNYKLIRITHNKKWCSYPNQSGHHATKPNSIPFEWTPIQYSTNHHLLLMTLQQHLGLMNAHSASQYEIPRSLLQNRGVAGQYSTHMSPPILPIPISFQQDSCDDRKRYCAQEAASTKDWAIS